MFLDTTAGVVQDIQHQEPAASIGSAKQGVSGSTAGLLINFLHR
jgi:hypothetical protein